jgi:hypothetical protein
MCFVRVHARRLTRVWSCVWEKGQSFGALGLDTSGACTVQTVASHMHYVICEEEDLLNPTPLGKGRFSEKVLTRTAIQVAAKV